MDHQDDVEGLLGGVEPDGVPGVEPPLEIGKEPGALVDIEHDGSPCAALLWLLLLPS